MTPLQMGIMLAAYSGNSDFLGCPSTTYIWQTQCQDLFNDGMIQPNASNSPWHIKITEKGKFWLEFILAMPYPTKVCKYEMGTK